MIPVTKWVILSVFFHMLLVLSNSETFDVRQALVKFMNEISLGNISKDVNFGWNLSSDPCTNKWEGITCDSGMQHVKHIILDQKNLTGILDAASVCEATSLTVLSLNENEIIGILPQEISNCRRLTHLYLHRNKFSSNLPSSLSRLNNLKRLVVSDNAFSGQLPDMSRISGLLTFLAERNQLTGQIPRFDFSNLVEFNVSYNNLTGPVPDVKDHFDSNSFLGNPGLCGVPLSNTCPPSPPPPPPSVAKKKKLSYLIYLGYAILGLIIIFLLALKLFKCIRKKKSKSALKDQNKNTSSGESKAPGNRSEYSITSPENSMFSASFEILSSPMANKLGFEDLLRAPAELIGKGKHGSVYKVKADGGVTLVVKRIRGWNISKDDFKKRMHRIHRMKHPRVLPLIAFYSSKQEKLIVYKYQHNGNLFKHLHSSQGSQTFDWASRLGIAATVAEALAFMHEGLQNDDIPHGNLKSTNILLNEDMEACISEYGLMVNNQDQSFVAQSDNSIREGDSVAISARNAFKMDVYSFGVILLELLTGKPIQASGYDLARWVNSVVREEWTGEVFDMSLIRDGANEERMINLLQVALKCINPSTDATLNMKEVALIINSIKEDEEKSMSIFSSEV
ncbi:PREDICTED: probable inactive receptor kinase At2g26730 [Nicotiana attenuata]|uniref:Inactive receptor kinase n=1 Tax=Nicotiana attenuata TaxID=49451 RepID=A0A314KRJ7_NICAT|nr:PREDICTED: probable inactive receptor kinase At2g26730 [Nicotiana attenuata]OIT31978.1 putative inactive receptor kinase [Nicotiana attenuata]